MLSLINGQLFHGHFDVWRDDGTILFRNNLDPAGGAVANDADCETLIRIGIEACERYFPPCNMSAGRAKPQTKPSTRASL